MTRRKLWLAVGAIVVVACAPSAGEMLRDAGEALDAHASAQSDTVECVPTQQWVRVSPDGVRIDQQVFEATTIVGDDEVQRAATTALVCSPIFPEGANPRPDLLRCPDGWSCPTDTRRSSFLETCRTATALVSDRQIRIPCGSIQTTTDPDGAVTRAGYRYAEARIRR